MMQLFIMKGNILVNALWSVFQMEAGAPLHPHHPSNRFLKFRTLSAPVTTPPPPSRAAARLGDMWLDIQSNWYDRVPTVKVFTTVSVHCWEFSVPSRNRSCSGLRHHSVQEPCVRASPSS